MRLGEMPMGAAIELTQDNFEAEVIKADVPVLVDFWAPWCGPCKMIAPLIDQVALEAKGRFVVGKLNIDDASMVAMKYGVQSIPTLLIFRNGEVVNKMVGATVRKDALVGALEAAA
jgi:thioredoxin 1